MSECGFLSPDGYLHKCNHYQHLAVAQALAEKLQGNPEEEAEPGDECAAENWLLRRGWVELNPFDCIFNEIPGTRHELGHHLTLEQKHALICILSRCQPTDPQAIKIIEVLDADAERQEGKILSSVEHKYI